MPVMSGSRLRRAAAFSFGLATYAASQLTLAYTFGFVGGMFTPTAVDGPARSGAATSVAINLLLFAVFGLQHSLMARSRWKGWVERVLGPGMERPVYVMATCMALGVLYAAWQPLPFVVFDLKSTVVGAVLVVLGFGGWLAVLAASLLVGHFHLFGLRQAWYAFRGQTLPPLPLRARALYRYVRHPMYLGTLVAFWVHPTMTLGRVLFASCMTAYVLIGIRFEERDLLREHGAAYEEYRRRVPMLLPSFSFANGRQPPPGEVAIEADNSEPATVPGEA